MDESNVGEPGEVEPNVACVGLKVGSNANIFMDSPVVAQHNSRTDNSGASSVLSQSQARTDFREARSMQNGIPDLEENMSNLQVGIQCSRLDANGPLNVNVGSGVQNVITYTSSGVEFLSSFGCSEPVACFVGRETELKLMSSAAGNLGKTVLGNTLVITGEGGVGKAETVRKFIQEHTKEDFEKVIWFDSEDRNTLNETIKRLGRMLLQIPTTEGEKEVEVVREAIYQKLGETKSLIVFNNVESFRDAISFDGIQSYLPRSIHSMKCPPMIIIISRASTGWEPGMTRIDLGPLRTEESELYLKNRLQGVKDIEDRLRDLVNFCSNVPIALKHTTDVFLVRRSQRIVYSVAYFFDEISAIQLWSPVCEFHPAYPPALLLLWDNVANGRKQNPGKYELELKDCVAEYKRRYTSFGKLSSDTLVARNHMAFLRTRQGEYKEALRIYKEVLRDRSSVLGPFHQCTLATKHDVGFVYNRMGKYKEALRVYESVYEERCRYIGVDSLDALITRHDIAYVHLKMGKYNEALRIYEDVYDKRKRSPDLGEDHPDTLTTKRDIGSVYIKQRKYEKALEVYESSYEQWCNLGDGPENPDALITAHDIAYVKALLGLYEEAVSLYHWVYENQVQVLGSADHPDALRTRNNLGYAYALMGDCSEALSYYQDVYPKQVQVLGTNHPHTLTTYQNIGAIYIEEKRYDDALVIFQEVSQAFENEFGPDNPDALTAKHYIAKVLESSDKLEDALKIYEQVWERRSNVLGAEHPDTLETRFNMDRLCSLIRNEL